MITQNSAGCRPSDKGGGAWGIIQTFRKRGGLVSQKNFFGPFGPQFGLKIRGDPGPPDPSPEMLLEAMYRKVKSKNGTIL